MKIGPLKKEYSVFTITYGDMYMSYYGYVLLGCCLIYTNIMFNVNIHSYQGFYLKYTNVLKYQSLNKCITKYPPLDSLVVLFFWQALSLNVGDKYFLTDVPWNWKIGIIDFSSECHTKIFDDSKHKLMLEDKMSKWKYANFSSTSETWILRKKFNAYICLEIQMSKFTPNFIHLLRKGKKLACLAWHQRVIS